MTATEPTQATGARRASSRRIARNAFLISGVALTMLLLNSATNYLVGKSLLQNIEKTRVLSQALRNHTLADMYHDVLRSLAFEAVSDQSIVGKKAEVMQQLSDATLNVNKVLLINQKLPLSPESHATVMGVMEPLTGYVMSVRKVIGMAYTDHQQAVALMPEMSQRFDQLEKLLAEVGDKLEKDAANLNAASDAYNKKAQIISALTSFLNFASLAGLALFLTRSVLYRIRDLELSMGKLANGDNAAVIPHTESDDEIGDMARTVQTFRNNAIERERLEQEAFRQEQMIADTRLAAEREREKGAAFQASTAEQQTRFIKVLSWAMSKLARGDTTTRLPIEDDDPFKQTKQDVNSMAAQISGIAGKISGVSLEVQGATREIASGINDLSVRTEHQASSLEETSASMVELSSTVRQNALNASEASNLASAAREAAQNGGSIAGQAIEAMARIENGSRQISDIVGLIQDIAFQTNLLALNAAVEAARAGESGKGFAVVANEVRALAQRAAQASKEIKQLIGNSSSEIKSGVDLVRQAGGSLTGIVASVKKVADLVSEIAAATHEQSSGIEQVSRAVASMDQMTQQNAALVEETNAALHSAQNQVDELRKTVSFFKTGENDAPLDANKIIRNVEASDAAAAKTAAVNPVRDQFEQLTRKIAVGQNLYVPSAAPEQGDWREF